MPETPTVLRWSAYEHEHVERGADWYWALGVIALAGALISILLADFLFAILIIVAAFTLGLLANKPPDISRFEISDRGVRINDELHRFEEILSFWVDEERTRPLLLVDTTKVFSPNLIIPIEHIDPDLVRAYLKERADEVPMREPLGHKLLEFFGM